MDLAADLAARVERVSRKRLVHAAAAPGGRSGAGCWTIHFADGASAFAKAATDEDTAGWLRTEHLVYSRLTESFVPRLLGWDDDGRNPLLLLEDLSRARWPPPWSEDRIAAVRETLARVAAVRGWNGEIEFLAPQRDWLSGWTAVAADPMPFLRLGLCSGRWLERALPILLEVQAAAPLAGEDFLHFEVRSDNLCFAGDRCVLVDWSRPRIGAGEMDVARWLPSLQAEGGPPAETVLPGGAAYAALLSGFWAARAGKPPSRRRPQVRSWQLKMLRVALSWAVRALGLAPLDAAPQLGESIRA
jgi:hypothetical protein